MTYWCRYKYTDLIDHLSEDEVSVFRAVSFNSCHEQITEAVDCVRKLVKQVEAARQHGVCEGMKLSGVQRLCFQKALQTTGFFLFYPLPRSPLLLLTPASCFLQTKRKGLDLSVCLKAEKVF